MEYNFYIDGLKLPITPEKLELKIKNNNKTISLIDDSEINVIKDVGLTDINFEFDIPQVQHYFADPLQRASVYLDKLEDLKVNKKAFQFEVTRSDFRGNMLFGTKLRVALEEYTTSEEAENGIDLTVKVSMKQTPEYGTKTVEIKKKKTSTSKTKKATVKKARESDNKPKQKTYTVKSGDCLYNIAKKLLGNGSRWKEIYNLNKSKIKNPNLIYPKQVLKIP